MPPSPTLHVLFIGGPKTLHDARGAYRSSIDRDPVQAPPCSNCAASSANHATQDYHGSLETAVCLHALAHYEFWNRAYGLSLAPGGVGENMTLDGLEDATLCVGDIYRVGTARLQISAPRSPCETQARRVGRPDWVKLTLQELRTGAYARVLTPGALPAGDTSASNAASTPA